MSVKLSIAIISTVTSAVFVFVPVYAAAPSFDDTQASSMISKINSYRVSNGKSALKYNAKLTNLAKTRLNSVYSSQTLINSGDVSHTIPGFGSFDSQAAKLGIIPTGVNGIGENFTISSSGLDGAYNNWLKSPSHLENILDGEFVYTGLALSTNLEEIGDPQIPSNLEPGGVIAIQTFATAEVIDGKDTAPMPTPSQTQENTNTPPSSNNASKSTPTPSSTTKTTVSKPKIDKTQKIGAKLKFDDLVINTTKLFS